MNNLTLMFFKTKELIQYICSFFLRDLWDVILMRLKNCDSQCLHSNIVTELIEQNILNLKKDILNLNEVFKSQVMFEMCYTL